MNKSASVLLCILLISGGCLSATETGPATVAVSLDGDLSVQSGTFHFNGTLEAQSYHTDENYVLRNVSVVLYTIDKREIKRVHVGKLRTNPGENLLNLSISSEIVPAYVIVESDNLWEKSVNVEVTAWRRTDDGFTQYVIGSKDDRFSQ